MKIIKLIAFIVISQLAGVVGSLFTFSAIPTWYAALKKPSFSPPNWIFGPVWITLYTLMGIAAYFVWQARDINKLAKPAIIIFLIHLALNALWSILFFGLKNPSLAFLEIIVLWLFIVVLVVLFYKIDKTAGYLLIPYLAWVSFAAFLNFSIWRLN
jgi:translocator protein